jgi:preprotein translocase subunit YajC
MDVYDFVFDVGDTVVVCGGRWESQTGEVLRITRCYVRIALHNGVEVRVLTRFVAPVTDLGSDEGTDSDFVCEIGDTVVVHSGLWESETGEVISVTRCYVRIALHSGFLVRVLKRVVALAPPFILPVPSFVLDDSGDERESRGH